MNKPKDKPPVKTGKLSPSIKVDKLTEGVIALDNTVSQFYWGIIEKIAHIWVAPDIERQIAAVIELTQTNKSEEE